MPRNFLQYIQFSEQQLLLIFRKNLEPKHLLAETDALNQLIRLDLDAPGRDSATYLRPLHRESSAMHAAELVGIDYRGKDIDSRPETGERGNIVVRGMRMEFDTGAGLTYLHPKVFEKIDSVVSSTFTL